MKEKKLQNCYNFIKTSLAFSNYLNQEMYISSRFIGIPTVEYLKKNPRQNYIYTLTTHAILLLSVFKEELLKKDEQDMLNLFISNKAFDSLMGNLIQSDGTKYKLGILTVDDKKEVLELLRNKLLHGDYYIENDKIYLCNEGITGEININDLIRTSVMLNKITDYKLTGINTRPMVLCKNNIIESGNRLDTEKDLKKLMQNTYFVEFYDEPQKGYERTTEYVQTLQKFYSELHKREDLIGKHTFQNAINLLMNEYKDKFNKHHIKLTYSIKPVAQSTEYSKIKTFFMSNKEEFSDMKPKEKRLYMVLATTNILEHQNSDYLKTSTALYNNMKAISSYLNGINPELIEYNVQQSVTFADDMTVAALFNSFYSIYHYGLDEIYTNGSSSTSLRDIAKGEYLNFALLDLDVYYDSSMTIEATFKDFPNQLVGIQNDVLEAKAKLEKAQNNRQGYLTNAKVQTEAKKKDLEDKVLAAKEKYDKAFELQKKAEEFMTNDFDKYVKNFNIISHIRNSFAHGNVRILPYVVGDPLLDQEIVMQDIYKGNCTYTLRVKFKDLHQLIEAPNAKVMLDFVSSKLPQPVKKGGHTHKLS